MKTYKVTSDRLTVGKLGESIDETALDGANIQALIDGAHIALVTNKKTDEQLESKDK